jgi:hypothetical protein
VSELVVGVRVGGAMERIDSSNIQISSEPTATHTLAWDASGDNYVTAWVDTSLGYRVVARQVAAQTGALDPATKFIAESAVSPVDLTAGEVSGLVAIAWSDRPGTRLVYLDVSANVLKSFTFDHGTDFVQSAPFLVDVPHGTTGLLYSGLVEEAPGNGAERIVLRRGVDLTNPIEPARPVLNATTRTDGKIQLQWNGSTSTDVSYRLEVKVGDGVWREVSTFVDGSTRSVIYTPTSKATHTFRLRVLGKLGLSEYSPETVVRFEEPKRRAVRK